MTTAQKVGSGRGRVPPASELTMPQIKDIEDEMAKTQKNKATE